MLSVDVVEDCHLFKSPGELDSCKEEYRRLKDSLLSMKAG